MKAETLSLEILLDVVQLTVIEVFMLFFYEVFLSIYFGIMRASFPGYFKYL